MEGQNLVARQAMQAANSDGETLVSNRDPPARLRRHEVRIHGRVSRVVAVRRHLLLVVVRPGVVLVLAAGDVHVHVLAWSNSSFVDIILAADWWDFPNDSG